MSTLPVHGSVEIAVLVVYGLAGLAGIAAIVYANTAAAGIPEILSGVAVSGQKMYQLTTTRAITARRQLGTAIKLAALAGALLIGVPLTLVTTGVVAASRTYATLVTPTGAYCGRLLDTGGVLSLRLTDGQLISIHGGSLTEVSSCPG